MSGNVQVINRARNAVKKSKYHDSDLIYHSLLLLKNYYVPTKTEGGKEKKDNFDNKCEELGLVLARSFSGTRHGEHGDTYIVKHNGKNRILDQHLKKGNSHNEADCFRLYFFWSEEDDEGVVGWLPSHLETRIS